ncbi:hypothetical protein ACFQL1_10935 [Halomicroarcula sp. GCM10025709]|uniref:DUF7269 family protein n=1 Tax=Haloarcula TaxID=2237 RepID=UPI0024C2A8CA|nr:hypothetical protein [Halomicroarcula sp. YJ-61-S]
MSDGLRPVPLAVGLGATVLAVGLGAVGVAVVPDDARNLLLIAVAVVAGSFALLALLVHSLEGDERPRLPDTDSRTATIPGDEVDTALSAGRDGKAIRDRLQSVALSVLERRGLTRSAAEQQLAEGTWTEDGRAAAVLSRGEIRPSLRARIEGWLSGVRPFHRWVGAVTTELLAREDDR